MNLGWRFVLEPVGAGSTSTADPVPTLSLACWQVTRDLWADIHKVELRAGRDGTWFEVTNGRTYAVPESTPLYIRAEVGNLGPATWLPDNGVRFAANDNYGGGFRWVMPPPAVPRLGNLAVPEQELTPGLSSDTDYQFQMVVEGRAWMDGFVRVRLVTY